MFSEMVEGTVKAQPRPSAYETLTPYAEKAWWTDLAASERQVSGGDADYEGDTGQGICIKNLETLNSPWVCKKTQP